MNLFDTLLDAVQGQNPEAANPATTLSNLMPAILSLVNNSELGGSLKGLIEKFSQAGLTEQVSSWISTAANQPITAEQIQTVLGVPFVQSFAEKLNIDVEDAAANLAKIVPQIIDKLTPDGEVTKDGSLMELGMSLLSGLMANKIA